MISIYENFSSIGPMVYSAFFCQDDQLKILTDLGCAGNKIDVRDNDGIIHFDEIRFQTIDRRTSDIDLWRIF